MKVVQRLLATWIMVPIVSSALAADADNGERLYVDYGCYACHGFNGTGRTPLSKEGSGILSSEALFIRYLRLRADQNPVNPKNSMPNYSEATLPDAAARNLYAYLLTLDDDPPQVDDIPTFMDILTDAKRKTEGPPDND